MRYYICDIDVINKFNMVKIDTINVIELYSLSGIYQIINDEIYKIHITDKNIYDKTIHNFKIIVDDSIINKKIVKHIQNKHIQLEKIIEKYDINNIQFTIEKNNLDKNIIAAYFEFNNQNKTLIKKISSLLLSIK